MFNKELFSCSGGYLSYDGKFVARFKYSTREVAGFKSFLIKNFTPAEYFAELASGKAPGEVLRDKGYLPRHVKDQLIRAGYPETVEGMYDYCKYLSTLRKAA